MGVDTKCNWSKTLWDTLFQEILRYFVQMLMSLQHVHSKQILHRDLKTHNILLDKNKEVVKISDFGISKVLSKSKAVTVSNDLLFCQYLNVYLEVSTRCYRLSSPNHLGYATDVNKSNNLINNPLAERCLKWGCLIMFRANPNNLLWMFQVVGTPCYISPELCESKPYPFDGMNSIYVDELFCKKLFNHFSWKYIHHFCMLWINLMSHFQGNPCSWIYEYDLNLF